MKVGKVLPQPGLQRKGCQCLIFDKKEISHNDGTFRRVSVKCTYTQIIERKGHGAPKDNLPVRPG